jgi:hypothetical protein
MNTLQLLGFMATIAAVAEHLIETEKSLAG